MALSYRNRCPRDHVLTVRRVPSFDTVTARLYTNQADVGFVMKSANIPMAFEPPPTQAITAPAGDLLFPESALSFLRQSSVKLTHNGRVRMRASCGTQHICAVS